MGNASACGIGMQSMCGGSEIELMRIKGARLYLVDEEESLLLKEGDFVLRLTKQLAGRLSALSLATVDAEVGDVHWPAAKDSPVCKIGERWYTFSIPGVFYELIFSEATSLEDLQALEYLLLEYCFFQLTSVAGMEAGRHHCDHGPRAEFDFIEGAGGDGSCVSLAAADSAESTSAKVARGISESPTFVREGISRSNEWAASSLQKASIQCMKHRIQTKASEAAATQLHAEAVEISPKMKAHVQRARRVSAVTKLISKALLKGVISASNHIRRTLSTAATTSAGAFRGCGMDGVVLASVDACANMVDAVELCGKNVLKSTGRAGSDTVHHRYGVEAGMLGREGFGALGNVMNTLWTLNKMGLGMLLRATAASSMMHFAQNHQSSHAGAATAGSSNSGLRLHENILPPSSNRSRKADDELYSSPAKGKFLVKDLNELGDGE